MNDRQYFLFGRDVIKDYYDTDDWESLVKRARVESFDLFVWDSKITQPDEILVAFNGWMEFLVIGEEDYNELKQIRNEK